MNEDQLYAMRHSLAHITAQAVQHLWPEAKFGVGPVVENGFYYDIDLGETKISEDDFRRIEKEMRGIISRDFPFERSEKPIEEALVWAKEANQPYKVELLNDLKREGTTLASELDAAMMGMELPAGIAGVTRPEVKSVVDVSFYTDGDFTDLCRGPHAESTGKVGAFKLMRVAGAYWRGNEKNAQMQRLYGVAFETQEDLDHHLEMLEEAKKCDHKKLGRELDLYFFHETSPGSAYWLPKGVVMYNELVRFWREEHTARGYQEIVSPLINKKQLYQTSGHYDHYWEDMFTIETADGEEYGVKPMNCPNAMVVFGHAPRSYKDLPLRLGDTDPLHRYELSGTLNGLLRARSFRQDDAHIFVTQEQIKEEYKRILEITELFYSVFDLKYSFRLGTRPKKFMGEPLLWDTAEQSLKEILDESGKEYFVLEGDGAFYGPKIDILMEDALGRPWQMGTLQLDFQQPLRFGLSYINANGEKEAPIAIHRVIYGSLERFIGILIEHTAGKLPVWLAPEQLRIVQVKDSEEVMQFVQQLRGAAQENGVRISVDDSNESVGKKIRNAEMMKVPYTIVVGEKEVSEKQLLPRIRKDLAIENREEQPLSIEQLINSIANESKARASKSSL